MKKPIQIIIEETKAELNNSISKIISSSSLPMCCITPILKEIYETCSQVEREQLELAKKKYNEEVAKDAS